MRSSISRFHPSGGAMILVLICFTIGGLALTAWTTLLSTRLMQADASKLGITRRLAWTNSQAANQQYVMEYQYRDRMLAPDERQGVTQPKLSFVMDGYKEIVGSTARTLNGFELIAEGFGNQNPADENVPGLQTFRSSTRLTGGPYNNVAAPGTENVFVTRTEASQNFVDYNSPYSSNNPGRSEHVLYYNFQKTYPRSLLGDLLIAHKSATGAAYTIDSSILVYGRILLHDAVANVSAVRAEQVYNLTKDGTNTSRTFDGSAVSMPTNLPPRPIFTAGYASGSNGAVTNGELNMADNADFPPGSMRHIMEGTGSANWMTVILGSSSTPPATQFYTFTARTSGALQARLLTSAQNTTNGGTATTWSYNGLYNSSTTSRLNNVTVTLNNSSLKHLRITSGVEQLELVGQSTSSTFVSAGSMPPIIIWIEQANLPEILLKYENNRPIILVTSARNGNQLNVILWSSSTNVSNVSGMPSNCLDWRIHFINEHTNLRLNHHPSLATNLIGGIRTNWTVSCSETSSTIRFNLCQQPVTDALLEVLPRDAWLETLPIQ